MTKLFLTRFAPSPTGHLHMGHAYSALKAFNMAKENGGTLLLRIEDIDITRCRKEYVSSIKEDLLWLGIEWSGDILIQSEKMAGYKKALNTLEKLGLTYPCFCTRADIKTQIENSSNAPHGPDGILYPRTCSTLSSKKIKTAISRGAPFAIRLDIKKSIEYLKNKKTWPLKFFDVKKGETKANPEILGDIVLARKDIETSYHLAVTLDDHFQKITDIIRGDDLFFATHIHRILQALLELDTPTYYHHSLLSNQNGERLSKRGEAISIKSFRQGSGSLNQFLDIMKSAPKS